MMQHPKILTIEKLVELLDGVNRYPKTLTIKEGFALFEQSKLPFDNPLINSGPFRLPEPRLGIIRRGHARAIINLLHREIKAPMIVFMAGGTIIQPLQISLDFELQGFALVDDLMAELSHHNSLQTFNGQLQDFALSVESTTIKHIDAVFHALTTIAKEPNYNEGSVRHLILSILHLYDEAYQKGCMDTNINRSREKELFERFISLVNQHAHHEHRISFYANRLCLTERYLSRIIKEISGQSAKEWIDRQLITESKVMLKYGASSVAHISEELGFPNPSFFNKFFKRIIGITPSVYRTS